MPRSILPGLVVAAIAVWAGSTRAGEPQAFRLIVHPDVPVTALSKGDVAEIFLKRRAKWNDGTWIHPVDQPIRSPLRVNFLNVVYGKTPSFMLRYWQRKIFSGRRHPPQEVAGDEEVIRFVSRTPGAIGYIAATRAAEGVKAVGLSK